MPEENLILQARNLHKFLGDDPNWVHVLKGVNLDLYGGYSYSVVGPSGCGKSTLLYILGLLDQMDEGSIWINGESIEQSTDNTRTLIRNKHIGFVFQFHFLLAEFTAAENVMMPMHQLGMLDKDQMRERANELLNQVGLGSKVERLATQLSGGEQQRVAIARALANQPAIILADEPTGNLDVTNSNIVFDLMCDLARQNGQAVLMVSHNPELAERTDVLLRMKDGQFVEE